MIAYNKVGWFRDFINTSFNVIKDIVVGVFKVLADTTKSTFDFITGFIGGAMDGAVKSLVITSTRLQEFWRHHRFRYRSVYR